MDAQIKQINIKPATYDKESMKVNDPYASITLNVPMQTATEREAVYALLEILGKEWCFVEIAEKQVKIAQTA